MVQRQPIVMLVGILIILLQMSLVFGKLWTSDGLIKNVKHPPCKPVPGVKGRMLRSLPKPTNSDSCPAKGIMNVGPGNCEIKKTNKESPAKIFVTDDLTPYKIFVSDLQDELNFTSIPASKNPRYMTYDSIDKKIYWTDLDGGSVFRADVDGRNREIVTNQGDNRTDPHGIAIAETLRTLYIAYGYPLRKITSVLIGQDSSMPGKETEFVAVYYGSPSTLRVDKKQRYLYWCIGTDIHRKSLDGTGSTYQELNIGGKEVRISLTHFTLGPISGGLQRLIFSSFAGGTAFYIDVNTNGTVERMTELREYWEVSGKRVPLLYLHDITLFNGVLYWTKKYNPPSIAVVTNYQYDNRSYEIKETSEIRRPFGLLVTTVDP